MAEPKMAQKMPYVLKEEPGEKWWCACGHSRNQPFCDGSHERLKTGMEPVQVEIEKPRNVAWCGCKRTSTPPFCDGTHSKLD